MPTSRRQINVLIEPVMSSLAMRRLDSVLRSIADKDVVVCLIGESGSGKEILARRIHELSSRRAAPFVPINCAALPETLFESELFGHERGAFTGANQLARGKVEAASGGTLFLDEIGELPLAMQAKLLRFVEHRRFMRVGGTKKLDADVRLICATLRPLEEEMARGTFRPDLFYRIQGITLTVPALRDRRNDIAPLVEQLVAEMCAKHRVARPRFTRSANALIREYDWPGNVRELRNVIERACILRCGASVRAVDLPASLRGQKKPSDGTMVVRLDRPLDETVTAIIRAAVDREGGNRTRAAERLAVGLRTVQRRLR